MITGENDELTAVLVVEPMFSMRGEDSSCGEGNILAHR